MQTITRHRQRQWAVQILYLIQSRNLTMDVAWKQFLILEQGAEEASYTRFLVDGVLTYQEKLDSLIEPRLQGWRMDRLSKVDLSILRLGLFELKYCGHDVPGTVALNEAIEIGKAFSGPESGKFINGVLAFFLEQEKN